MRWLESSWSSTASDEAGSQKLGHGADRSELLAPAHGRLMTKVLRHGVGHRRIDAQPLTGGVFAVR
jgi:hypothetical protein